MNGLQVFKNDEFSIKSLVIDNEPWFVGKDVAEALGYAKPLNAIAQHVDNDDSLKRGLTEKENIKIDYQKRIRLKGVMKNETNNKRKNYDCNHIVLSGVLLKCGR